MKLAALAMIAIVAGCGIVALAVEDAPTPSACVADAETRERARAIMLEAIDLGLKNHIVVLFDVLLKDSHAQPKRARTGVFVGIRAYNLSRRAVLRWNPPICLP